MQSSGIIKHIQNQFYETTILMYEMRVTIISYNIHRFSYKIRVLDARDYPFRS